MICYVTFQFDICEYFPTKLTWYKVSMEANGLVFDEYPIN